MSVETIGPVVMFVMLLGFLLFVGLGLRGDEESAPDDDRPRRSLE